LSTVVESELLVSDEPAAPRVERRKRPLRLRVHSVVRWLHIYTSMVSLLIVLFFAVTGVTLNHPDWLATEQTRELTGQLTQRWMSGDSVDWLVIADELRAKQGVHGSVTNRSLDASGAMLTYKAPGYSADAVVDTATGKYQLTVAYQGAVGVLNDLHRGRDAGGTWAWVIDAAGFFLVALSATGLGLLLYLKKVRARALLAMVGGAVLVTVLAVLIR
jgi:hypothetical protein